MDIDSITGLIVNTAYKVHTGLGPGLLESVYETVLAGELMRQGLHVQRQLAIDFEFEGTTFQDSFRLDLFVERAVIVELKSLECLAEVHFKQILTYLRLSHVPVGLLINFGASTLREGLHRVVNNYKPSAGSPFTAAANKTKKDSR